jgi:hypothetical protein
MPLSKEDLTSVQGDVTSVYVEGASCVHEVTKAAIRAAASRANKPKEVKVEADKAAWSKYSQGLEGQHPVSVSVIAARRARRAGESPETISKMLEHDPFTQQLALLRGSKNAQSYIEVVMSNAEYREKQTQALQKQQSQLLQQQSARSQSRSR